MSDATYDAAFYADQRDGSAASARVVVPLLRAGLPLSSVVDIGCGVGTWLAAFAASGIDDLLGLDGDYVARDMLVIPPERFRAADLASPPPLGRRFDLALCLEVAEHLPADAGPVLIAALCDAAPLVLFSAAIPGQGGTAHVNERWQDAWRADFAAHGYEPVDLVRPRVAGDARVAWWYQQNIVLYAAPDAIARHQFDPVPPHLSLDRVHPVLYERVRSREDMHVTDVLRMLPDRAGAAVRRRIGAQ